MKFKFKRVTTIWLMSYLVILIVPILINIAIFSLTEKSLIKQINNYSMQIFKNESQNIDTLIDKMINIAIETSLNSDIMKYAKNMYPFSPEDKYDFSQIRMKYLSKLTLQKDVDNMFVYYPNSDYILGLFDNATIKDFYMINSFGTTEEYNSWNTIIKDTKVKGYFTFKNIIYYKYIPFSSNLADGDIPIIVIMLNSNSLLNTKKIGVEDDFFILNEDNDIFFPYVEQEDALRLMIKDTKFLDGQLHVYRKYKDKHYVFSWVASQSYKWRYIFVTDEKKYLSEANYVRNAMSTGMVACLILGFMLIYFSIKRNNRPIHDLVQKLNSYNYHIDDKINEYQYIDSVVMDAISKKEEYFSALSRQKTAVRDGLFAKLLKGTLGEEEQLGERLVSLDVNFKFGFFAVAVFYIESVSEIFFEEGEETTKKYEQAKFILKNIVEEMLCNRFSAYMCQCDENLSCIINVPNDEKVTVDETNEIIIEATEFILKNFNIEFVTSLSNIHSTTSGICTAYEEAVTVMEYKFIRWEEVIIPFSSINQDDKADYYYPIEKEQLIINYFKSGEYEKCVEVLNGILDVNFGSIRLPLTLARCLMFDITSTYIKAINEISSVKNNEIFDRVNFVERITTCETVVKMRQEMIIILKEFCQYIDENVIPSNDKLITDIIEFVHEYYYDTMLNVAVISDKFNINANYLSGIFKKNMDVGLLEYITKVRIEKSKELMRSSDDTLDVISLKVGYNNFRTFFRVFSKYEGIAPGKYRQTNS